MFKHTGYVTVLLILEKENTSFAAIFYHILFTSRGNFVFFTLNNGTNTESRNYFLRNQYYLESRSIFGTCGLLEIRNPRIMNIKVYPLTLKHSSLNNKIFS